MCLQAVVRQLIDDLNSEASGAVETVPGSVRWGALVRGECNVGPGRRRRRPRFRRRARRTGV